MKVNGDLYCFLSSTQSRTGISFELGDEYRYNANFYDRSFHRGERFKIFKGKFDGNGPMAGDQCVVKIPKQADLGSEVIKCYLYYLFYYPAGQVV